MDVAYALNEVYSGIYSSVTRVRSLRMERYSDAKTLIIQGFGKGQRTRVLIIHEAQGLTSEGTVLVRIAAKHNDSVSHAVVAITRHTVNRVYHTTVKTQPADLLIGPCLPAKTK
ncbi:hypothetical protein EVAR_3004_1 [Eumeta japonica]|uniref:(+)RNA virus helicase C-terminal domain-containing protein n=1 Tax=Eumeta variegata TaxID=151549 RepID=A0A4C1SWT1_EUMVA|nr:hypothetical protein EVAR_3004_1 [Eumeta japonica]